MLFVFYMALILFIISMIMMMAASILSKKIYT